ncbi:MAG: ROK family protein [Candidatus Omnitrophica bacterium]|nr:ROK family protein [Candidatus Omnitrophota bacterium]
MKMLFDEDVLSEREKKNLIILDLIRKIGPTTRTDISRIIGLNIVTVTNYVNSYVKSGIVIEKGLDISTGGRRPALVELNKKWGYVLGVDIGPVNTIAVISDLANNVISKIKKPRPKGFMDEVIAGSLEIVKELIDTSKIDKALLKGIGMGISGVIDERSGTIRDTDPTRGKTVGSYSSIKTAFGKEFRVPTFVGNDATVAAFGEKRLGLEEDVKDMIYVYSDVGCGIIIKGEIYCGAGGSAGEVQVSIDNPDLDKFNCWQKGPCFLRPWGVDLGITEEAKKIVRTETSSKIYEKVKGKLEDITLDTVIDAAKEGDKVAQQLIEDAGINLGIRVAYLINLFNPEIVVIGGGVEKAGELLLNPVKRTVRKLAFEESASIVKIIPSVLGENAVALGAASLVVREVFMKA